ncbi:MAG: baseplate J/gp47 family protein [Anaerorhabdus sp.]|uniref:baseplate J/gp47 family protein n=1 Tax=Anaerorhabdus sp. TaxID=1872524 RepID=UPI003A898D3B
MNESSYEAVLNRMIDQIPKDLDKREGSVIYTALAPAAMELSRSYWLLGWLLNLMLPDTAVGEYLDKLVAQFGVNRYKASKAIRVVQTFDDLKNPLSVSLSSRFRIGNITLKLLSEISTGKYQAEVEQPGVQGNQLQGELLPIQNINSLGSAELLPDVILEAQDEETDEELRIRFYEHVHRNPFGGNISDYEEKCMGIEGVGAVQVFPIWDGPGSVFLMIGNESQREATIELVEKVQKIFQPREDSFDGLAPIGHVVTVGTSKNLRVDINASLKLSSGTSIDIVKERVTEEVTRYINSISFREQAIYHSKVIVAILNVEGVLDVTNLTLNNTSGNLELSKTATTYQTPAVGSIILV